MIRLKKNAFAHILKKATIETTGDSETEVNGHVDLASTLMRVLTIKYGDL